MDSNTLHVDERTGHRAAGVLLITTAVLAGAMMVLHPTSGTHDPAEFVERMGRGVRGNAAVHGMLIGLMMLMTPGYLALAERLGSRRLIVRIGLVAMVFGTAAGVVAGIVNGFVVPSFASRVEPGAVEAAWPVIRVCSVVNQIGAKCCVIGLGMAAVAWGAALLALGGWRRWAGLAGVMLGLTPVGLLAAGVLRMDVVGFGSFVAMHCAWTAIAGAVLLARPRP